MIKKITLSALLLSSALFVSERLTSRSAQPPASNTNAPGEQSCAKVGCHNGTLNSGNGSVNLQFPQGTYTPGTKYTLTATVTDSIQKRFGFQVTSLNASDSFVGTWTVTNSNNTAIVSGSGRDYMGHKSASGLNTWTFDWTAPPSGQGTITFYLAGNAADSTFSTANDLIYAQSFTWDEGTGSSPVEITGASSVCEDESASFSASAGFNTYKWSTGETSQSIVYPANSSGMKTIWVLADSGLSSESTDTVMLQVWATPNGPIINDIDSLDKIVITNVAPISTYEWYKDGTKMAGETDTMLNYTAAGDYHVVVTDSNGCTNTSNTVSAAVFVGVAYDLRASFDVYPNPSSGSVNITNALGYSMKVLNLNGQMIQSVPEVRSNNMMLELTTGMYFIQLENAEETVVTKVVVR